jgi:hypothetical protein
VRYARGRLSFWAPRELAAELRAEIYMRKDTMSAPPRRGPRAGACDCCLDPLPSYQGGWCPLCTAAREVALR